MDILLVSAVFIASLFCAGLMGFAIQRGATCTVAAVDEFVSKRKLSRLISLMEASLWVVGGLLIAQALGVLPRMPAGHAVGWLTIVGALLLGLGAFINGACVFGAIARLGSGEWAYVLTPLGFYIGCLTVTALFPPPLPGLSTGSPLFDAAMWLAILFGALMLFRVVAPLVVVGKEREQTIAQRVRIAMTSRIWSPHAATGVIGVTFVLILLLIGGTWAYTDVLADLARGMANSLASRILLVIALFAGAIIGGYTAGRFRSTRITAAQMAKCFAGGMMMGWGTLLIPGSNDGLILIGMPLLRPYAWIAFLTMCIAIGAALLARQYVQQTSAHETVPHG